MKIYQWHGLAVPRAGNRFYVTGSIRGLSRSYLTYIPGGWWLEERKLISQASSITEKNPTLGTPTKFFDGCTPDQKKMQVCINW